MLGGVMVLIRMDSNFLTINQVAAKFGVDRTTVVRLIKDGKFRANHFGRKWYIDRKSLEAYFNSNGNQTAKKEIATT
jgi:excisionase family DNA binding protein